MPGVDQHEHGEWLFSMEHRQPCLVIERQDVWGRSSCRVWLPSTDATVRIDATQLKPLAEGDGWSKERLCYLAAAGRIADALRRLSQTMGVSLATA
jgi:hypothetical protein